MTHIWQALLLAISSTLDDLGVGFSFGLTNPLRIESIVTVGSVSGLTMFFGVLAGQFFGQLIPAEVSVYLSVMIFTIFGVLFMWEGYSKSHDSTSAVSQLLAQFRTDKNSPNTFTATEFKNSVILGGVLGINSLALGFSGGMVGFPIFMTAALTAAASFLFVWSGSKFGETDFVQNLVGDRAEYTAGALMLILAALQLL